VSHEGMSARRWPIVTSIIIVACVAVQIAMTLRAPPALEVDDAHVQALQYFAAHPYLDVKPGVVSELDPATVDMAHTAARTLGEPDDETRRAEQQRLDAILDGVAPARTRDDPMRRFGYVPARHNLLGLLTSPFLHDGWLHLVGNMWFLFFCGVTLEDRWGRVVFPLFYVAAGAVAALVHGALCPHDTVPLVGASGAIAGCMGAFTVAFARTPVRFLWLLAIRPKTLTAPAFVVLPVWAAFEALWGLLFPGSDTAHWAHVGGFAFGVVVGLALRHSGLDRRLDDAVEVAAVLSGDPRIEEARRLAGAGRRDEAIAMLEGLAIERPDSPVVHEALAEIAAGADSGRAAKARERAERLRRAR